MATVHTTEKNVGKQLTERPPVIAIMGHIDHGKSTLLDYIRKTDIAEKEAGGITQQIGAYEVIHTTKEGAQKKITFLDTPGHEAFEAMRKHGAHVADIAVLVVAADDGVKPQTKEALKTILAAHIPYIVAITKIDKPGADVERIKQNLAEHEIFVEGYGGTIPVVPVSAKTGESIDSLLDMMLLVAEFQELKADSSATPSGTIIETHLDKKKGVTATVLIKNGTLRSGMYLVAGSTVSPGRMIENSLGKQIKEATFSSPVRVIGWSDIPTVGGAVHVFNSKKETELYFEKLEKSRDEKTPEKNITKSDELPQKIIVPLIIKTHVSGVLEAIDHELARINTSEVELRVISSGIGEITETDVKAGAGKTGTIIIGFNTKADTVARSMSERLGIPIHLFDVIYKLTEWLASIISEKTPQKEVEQTTGIAKIIRLFSHTKDKQVVGGRVEKDKIAVGCSVKIMRRENEIGRGRIRELQQQKNKATEVEEGREFGALIEAKIEIAPGDRIECILAVKTK